MKEDLQPLGDWWDSQGKRLKEVGFDPTWVDFEMQMYRVHALQREEGPQGEADFKRMILPIINSLIKGE